MTHLLRTAGFASLLLAFAVGTSAAPMAPKARAEVGLILSSLQASGCQFNRNGSWYAGADARAHLQRKLEYLEKKGLVQTAEQFIALGATSSSSSGQAYQVKCKDAPPVPSNAWLLEQLKQARAAGAAPAGGAR